MKNSTFNYVLKRVLVFLVISVIIMLFNACSVHAETFDVTSNTTMNGYYEPNYWSVSGQSTRNILMEYEDWQFYTQAEKASFGYVTLCANFDLRANNLTATCGDGCLSDINVVNLGGSCSINADNTTYTGNIYYLFYSIKELKWKNADTLPYFKDYITIENWSSGNGLVQINYNFLSNDNIYNDFALSNRLQELQETTNTLIQNQTTSIINNQNDNTQDIIDNQNDNTQDIIDNQNQNTQDMIDSQVACTKTLIDKNSILESGKALLNNGTSGNSNTSGITDYIDIEYAKKISTKVNGIAGAYSYMCFYQENKTTISCLGRQQYDNNDHITIPSNAKYVRFTINIENNKPQFEIEICKNGNQALVDSLTDDSSPSLDALNNSAGWLPAGPVDSILNLPIALLNNLTTNLSKSCQPVILPIPYINQNITLPCVYSLYEQMGITTWVGLVGTIASALILFSYLAKLYKWVDDTLTFRENNSIDNWGGI